MMKKVWDCFHRSKCELCPMYATVVLTVRHDYMMNLSFQVLVCKLCHDTYEPPEGYYAILRRE